jgi:hypothetical protein
MRAAWLVAVLGVMGAGLARADGQPAEWRLVQSDLTIFRENPIGLETRARLGVQKRLYAAQNPALENNYVFAGFYPRLNPASAQLGAGVELQPLSVFQLKLSAEVVEYYGTFGILQSFTSPTADYGPDRLAALADAGTNYSASAVHFAVEPLVQAKLGPIALRDQLHLDYWNFHQRAGDTVVYESSFDTLLPDAGWVVSNDADLLWISSFGLVLGLRHTLVVPRYRPDRFADPALDGASNALAAAAYDGQNSQQRLGLLAAYTFYDHPGRRFNRPTVLIMTAWYLEHRYRTGQEVNQAIPYLLVGFAFDGELLRW